MIKAGDTLLFDVELLGFHEKAKEKWEMSAKELMAEATKLKVLDRASGFSEHPSVLGRSPMCCI